MKTLKRLALSFLITASCFTVALGVSGFILWELPDFSDLTGHLARAVAALGALFWVLFYSLMWLMRV